VRHSAAQQVEEWKSYLIRAWNGRQNWSSMEVSVLGLVVEEGTKWVIEFVTV
jgi:kynureninase